MGVTADGVLPRRAAARPRAFRRVCAPCMPQCMRSGRCSTRASHLCSRWPCLCLVSAPSSLHSLLRDSIAANGSRAVSAMLDRLTDNQECSSCAHVFESCFWRRGSVSCARGMSVPSAEALAAALAGVEQALPAVAPWYRAQLLAAVAALAARSPAKVCESALSRASDVRHTWILSKPR